MSESNGQLPEPHQYFGEQFQLWRTEAQMTREAAAGPLGYSAATIKAVEQARRPVPPPMAEKGDEVFGANGKLKKGLKHLGRGKFPERSEDFFAYEAEAVAVWWYETMHIPGLLQTREYAQALIGSHWPPLDDALAQYRLNARLERQKLLDRSKPPLAGSFVIHEAALRTPIGGPDVQKGQLLHLLELGERHHLLIQALPYDRVIPAALSGPMVLLENMGYDRYALAEGQGFSHFTSAPDDNSQLHQRYGMIRSQALTEEETARFIELMVEKL